MRRFTVGNGALTEVKAFARAVAEYSLQAPAAGQDTPTCKGSDAAQIFLTEALA